MNAANSTSRLPVADLRKPENARYEGKKLSEVAAGMQLP